MSASCTCARPPHGLRVRAGRGIHRAHRGYIPVNPRDDKDEMRRRQKTVDVARWGPLVCDAQGRPVGVHVDAAPEVEKSALAQRVMRRDALRRTGELEAQNRLRCQVSVFCSNPPR